MTNELLFHGSVPGSPRIFWDFYLCVSFVPQHKAPNSDFDPHPSPIPHSNLRLLVLVSRTRRKNAERVSHSKAEKRQDGCPTFQARGLRRSAKDWKGPKIASIDFTAKIRGGTPDVLKESQNRMQTTMRVVAAEMAAIE